MWSNGVYCHQWIPHIQCLNYNWLCMAVCHALQPLHMNNPLLICIRVVPRMLLVIEEAGLAVNSNIVADAGQWPAHWKLFALDAYMVLPPQAEDERHDRWQFYVQQSMTTPSQAFVPLQIISIFIAAFASIFLSDCHHNWWIHKPPDLRVKTAFLQISRPIQLCMIVNFLVLQLR